MAVSRFIDHWTYEFKLDSENEVKAWIEANETQLAESFPDGTRLLGLYTDVIGGDGPALAHLLIGLDSYGALDDMAEALRGGQEFARLAGELVSLFEEVHGRRLIRSMSDVVIIGG